MVIRPARRTEKIKEYYFSMKLKEIARMNDVLERNIINLGIGSPDGMPPEESIRALTCSAVQSGVHAYQSYVGIPELRRAFAGWYARYYGVELDPENEIQPLAGSKEGILIVSLAFLDKGDRVLVPNPGYPTYSSASRLAEAEIVHYDLKGKNGWMPDFDALESMDLDGVKIMWTNYPNMPTGASASPELYARLVDFGRRHGIMICNDNPYSFILTDRHLSILSVPGAKDCCIELNSLSKAHNMSGWRIGMVAGAADVVSELLKVKSQMDSGMFRPVQLAAVEALKQGPEWFEDLNAEYRRRKDLAAEIFDLLGAKYDSGSTGMFLWGHIDAGNPFLGKSIEKHNGYLYGADSGKYDDIRTPGEQVSDAVLYGAGVFITPGFIFGSNGNDYMRISLCAPQPVIEEARERIECLAQKQHSGLMMFRR